MFNILVNTEYEQLFENLLAEAPESFSLTLADFTQPDQKLNQLLKKTDAIIGQVNLSDSQYEAAANLKIIQTLSAGFDRIDLKKARQYQVPVANNNGANASSVAEHVLMMIFALYRQLLFHHQSVACGPWKNLKHTNRELTGKALGIYGLGHVGKALAQRAAALGCKVQYFDILRQPQAEKKWNLKYLMPDELLYSSDIISYHVPKTSYTHHLINQDSLHKMRPDSLLINTSRGDVQDENVLVAALSSGKISGAGLDVFEIEPLPENSALRNLKNVVLTPHSSPDRECYIRTVKNALDNLIRVSKGAPPQALAVDHEEISRKFFKRFPELKMNAE
ncbi:MAG: D-glycerate dehydrogenase [SAR324 cluster bacterium]|nr:D-glycerate dehydrogenase [SAR324 cluster bacterium]MBL7035812.1 D-glycerate dehydrogenase [SAR324 cluster bacterium]